jgi:DNA-binding response OmpR family regulator
MSVRILLVESGEREMISLRASLSERGYIVTVADGLEAALVQVKADPPDLVILSTPPTGLDGPITCESLQRAAMGVLVMVIGAGPTGEDTQWMDECIPQSLTARQFQSQVRRILRTHRQRFVRQGKLTLDTLRHRVFRRDGVVNLTPKESQLLLVLMKNSGKVLTRKTLMKEVWETDYLGDTRTLDVHIRWIREKIEENPSKPVYLRTVRGVGYRFEVPETLSSSTSLKT